MAKQLKLFFAALLAMLFIPLSSVSAAAGPTWIVKTNYVALGDSLAAGIDPQGKQGEGYADMIAAKIEGENALAAFNKGFAKSGYKTSDVLQDIKKDVTRDIIGKGYTKKTASLKDSIRNADIITISAGANDVLQYVKANSLTGGLEYDQQKLAAGLKEVGENLTSIQNEIKKLNPQAKVYVMGYYNPFPYLATDGQPMVDALLNQLNGAIKASTAGAGSVYVDTKDAIAGDYREFLPNPQNIHLSIKGYEQVAEKFWNHIKSFDWIPAGSLKATEVGADSVKLSWTKPQSELAISGYEIHEGDKIAASVDGNTLSHKLTGLDGNKNHQFVLTAIDAKGNKSHPALKIDVKTSPEKPAFPDLKEEWSKEYVKKAVDAGIIKGYADNTFRPYQPLTRVQAAVILVRTLNLETNEKAPFTDLGGYDKQTQRDLDAAYKYGLAKGANNKFMPNKKVTRAQMALMIHRTIEFKTGRDFNASARAPYTDFGAYDEANVNAISVLYQLNIATGSNGKFMPSSSVTREQAAKIFVNTKNVLDN